MKEIRYFYAHSKGTPDEEIDSAVIALSNLLSGAISPNVPKVVSGRDDYKANAQACGGWKGWQSSVATGTTITGEPRYHGYILPSTVLGRATAEMIETALAAGKPAIVWSGGHDVKYVTRIDKISSSWTDGYRAVLA